MEEKVGNRWRFVGAALVMQLCLGVLYSWSVFRGPLETLNGWSKTTSIQPFTYSLLFFTVAMVVAGFWQDKKGPRLVGSVGGLLLGQLNGDRCHGGSLLSIGSQRSGPEEAGR